MKIAFKGDRAKRHKTTQNFYTGPCFGLPAFFAAVFMGGANFAIGYGMNFFGVKAKKRSRARRYTSL